MTTGIFNVMVRHNSEQLQSNMQITSAVLSAANTSTTGGQCLYQPALCVCFLADATKMDRAKV
jgi:curli biogenesis system outer membrane secretion channel CsgG